MNIIANNPTRCTRIHRKPDDRHLRTRLKQGCDSPAFVEPIKTRRSPKNNGNLRAGLQRPFSRLAETVNRLGYWRVKTSVPELPLVLHQLLYMELPETEVAWMVTETSVSVT